MRILHSAPMTPGSVSLARIEGERALGHEVFVHDHRPYFRTGGLWRKIQAHLLFGPVVTAFACKLCEMAERHRPDLVFSEAFYLPPRYVRRLRASGAIVIGYTSDYFGYRSYFYRHLRASAGEYHFIVITNQCNVEFLRRWGAREVVMTRFGYDPARHYPAPPSEADRRRFECDVAFGGHREPFYEDVLRALKQAGLRLRVSGANWQNAPFLTREEKVGQLTPEEYRAMICSARIALALLSKWNRNTAGGRIFEVAAMGAFLLAERTGEQLGYFAEGSEAEFFSNRSEAVDKCRRLLNDGAARQRIAVAGHRRCLTSGYTYVDRTRELLLELEERRRAR